MFRVLSCLRDQHDYRLVLRATDVGASIGIALFPEDGATAEQILANADMALYRAKGFGRGGACFFEPDMDLAAAAGGAWHRS